MIRFQAFGVRFTLPFLSLLAPLLCVRLGMKMNMAALVIGVGAHELSHILAAKLMRISITEIQLTPFGGSARMENPYGISAKQLLIAAISGPIANLLLAIIFAAMTQWGMILPRIASGHVPVNLTLFLFNLLPALPLDGGRILYCLLQAFTTQGLAQKIGIITGKLLASALVLISFYTFISSGRLNLCLILVSVFLFASARDEQWAMMEARTHLISTPIDEPQPVRLYQMDAHCAVKEALQRLRPKEAAWFFLTDRGKPAGLLDSGSLISHFRAGGPTDITLGELSCIQFTDISQNRISSIRFNSSSLSAGASNARRFSRI